MKITLDKSQSKSRKAARGPGKVGSRSGKPAFKARSARAVRRLSKQALDEAALEIDRADAKLADQIFRTAHPEPLLEAMVLGSGKPGKKKPTAAVTKKRAAQALLKELDEAARAKSKRKAKRRATARALKKARKA
jgi:hypothetical protein